MIKLKTGTVIATFFLSGVLSACNSGETSGTSSATDTTSATQPVSKNEDWVSLYNGKDLSGWHSYGKDSAGSAWKAEDSAIHLDASKKSDWQAKGGGDLTTNDEYDNFDLKLEWKISEAGNSGIIFYIHEDTSKFKNSWESGLEMQVADNAKNEDGKIKKHMAGDLYDLVSSTSPQVLKPAGQWNAVEIISNNGDLKFSMNGQNVLSTTLWNASWDTMVANSKFKTMPGFGTYKKGKIALQDHGADVWYRNIMIKKL